MPENRLSEALHPVIERIYRIRGIESAEELELGLDRLPPATQLPGAIEAAALLQRTLARNGRILIVADFDADGATSCALAVRALKAMGADVEYLVPNRFEFGYGLTSAIVVEALKREPDLIITVDNGISSLEGVAAAKRAGVAVLITDHHLPGAELPEADVIVNPTLPGKGFPSDALAGVGVIFYVMLALRSRLREQDWFEREGLAEPNMADLLDLVALGTVADVVPFDHVNRILVQQGLQRIRAGRCCVGIEVLLDLAKRDRRNVISADLGFSVAPRLNAAGRLEDMSLGIECLLTDDPVQAREMGEQLDEFNLQRRRIEREMHSQALGSLDAQLPGKQGDMPFGLCIYHEDWHQGVVGILASRIRERFNRPVIAFAPAEGGMLKGSARSVKGLHIRDALESVATRYPGLLVRFGGHAMAAGLTLQESLFAPFSEAFDAEVRRHLDADDLSGVIHSDGPLEAHELNREMAERLWNAGPWGHCFPEPLFDGEFHVAERRRVKEHHLKLVLQAEKGGGSLDAIAFNQVDSLSGRERKVRAAYRLQINHFRGNSRLQLLIEHLEPLPENSH